MVNYPDPSQHSLHGYFEKLWARTHNMVRAVTLKTGDDTGIYQSHQTEGYANELRPDVPRVQEFGVSSMPLPGAEGIVVSGAGGYLGSPSIISTNDPRYRPKNQKPGEYTAYMVDEADAKGENGKLHSLLTGAKGWVTSLLGKTINIGINKDDSPTIVIGNDSATIQGKAPNGDMVIHTVSLVNHKHSDVLSGSSITGPPVGGGTDGSGGGGASGGGTTGNVTVSGTATMGTATASNLNVTGPSTLNGLVSTNSITSAGNVSVVGTSTLNGPISANSANFAGDVAISGALTIGSLVLGSTLSITNMIVNDDLSVNSDLSVVGNSVLNGPVTCNGISASTLAVTGTSVLNGMITANSASFSSDVFATDLTGDQLKAGETLQIASNHISDFLLFCDIVNQGDSYVQLGTGTYLFYDRSEGKVQLIVGGNLAQQWPP